MSRFTRLIPLGVCFALAVAQGQQGPVEAPRSLTGSIVAGWLDSTAKETFTERTANPFTSVQVDFRSYLLAPEILTFRIQPRYSSGFEDAFTGMSEGSGVAFESVLFPTRAWPFRFHYSRFERATLTAGLDQSYTRFLAKNNDSDIGFQWHLITPKLPTFEANFDKVSAAMTPEAVLTQGFHTRSQTLSLASHDERFGWTLSGAYGLQRLDTQYMLGSDASAAVMDNLGNLHNLTFLAQRPIVSDLLLTFSGNRTENQSNFAGSTFYQTFDSYSGRLAYQPASRFQAWTQARYTASNLETHVTGLLNNGQAPPSIKVANRMLDSEARVSIFGGFSVFGRNEYTDVKAPATGILQQAGSFMNTGGGTQFNRTYKTLVLAGSYYVFTTLTNLSQQTSGRALGHAVETSAAVGDVSNVRIGGSFSWNKSRDNIRNLLPYDSMSQREQANISHRFFHRWTLEAEGALTRSDYIRQPVSSNFNGKDYGANLTGRRFYLGYVRATGSGGSFQQILGSTTAAPIDFSNPLQYLVGTSNSSTTMSASWHMSGRLSIVGVWRGQQQTIGSQLGSRFEQQEASIRYQFRKIRVEPAYALYRFNFGSPIQRKSYIIRLTRDFQLF